MAELNELKFKFDTSEIDRIVRITCLNKECKHHVVNEQYGVCNLKVVKINENGTYMGDDK